MKRREFIQNSGRIAVGTSLFPFLSKAGNIAGDRPNIIFIMCDQWRKHALGFMHQDHVLTPNLDALASRSAVFSNAISTVPVCGPNRACLFSGKYSMRTGLISNDCRLLPEHQTFGEISKAAGYQTAYIGKWHLGDNPKAVGETDRGYVAPEYRHGFDFWYESDGHQPFRQPWFVGDDIKKTYSGGSWEPDFLVDTATTFIQQRDKARPFAMTLSFAPPHTGGGPGFEGRKVPGRDNLPDNYGYAAPEKYEAPYVQGGSCYARPVRENVEDMDNYEESKCVQGYFGAITAIDDALGRFFQTLEKEGLMKNSLLIFTADHGEMMGSHGRMTKGVWYQEAAGIPMIVSYPAAIKPAQYNCVFNSIDVLPTILGLCGLPNPGNLDGVDFSAKLRGYAQKTPDVAFGGYYRGGAPGYQSNNGWRHFRTVYTERYTYLLAHSNYVQIAGGKELLYDRQVDPYEVKPIKRGDGQNELMDHFKGLLAQHLNEVNDPFLTEVWPKSDKDVDWTPYRELVKKTYF